MLSWYDMSRAEPVNTYRDISIIGNTVRTLHPPPSTGAQWKQQCCVKYSNSSWNWDVEGCWSILIFCMLTRLTWPLDSLLAGAMAADLGFLPWHQTWEPETTWDIHCSIAQLVRSTRVNSMATLTVSCPAANHLTSGPHPHPSHSSFPEFSLIDLQFIAFRKTPTFSF